MSYINHRWLAEKHDTLAFVEERSGMPVNPPNPIPKESDIPMSVGILNWLDDDGSLMFVPRVRERNDWIDGGRAPGLEKGFRAASDDEAPELDYDGGYDCD